MTEQHLVERWKCPICGTTIGLYLHAHGRPECRHGNVNKRPVLMVLITDPQPDTP